MSSVKSRVMGVIFGASVLSSSAFAAGSLAAPTLATDDFVTVAGAVLVAAGVMWAIKKALSLVKA